MLTLCFRGRLPQDAKTIGEFDRKRRGLKACVESVPQEAFSDVDATVTSDLSDAPIVDAWARRMLENFFKLLEMSSGSW